MKKPTVAVCNFANMPRNKTKKKVMTTVWTECGNEVAMTYFKELSHYRTNLEGPSHPIHDTTDL
jgi:hypothetical protein